MTRRLTFALAALLAILFAVVVIRLFNIQLAAGDVYPEYSTLRSDPNGAKLLYDSLTLIPDVRAERNYLPLQYLPERDATILFLAMPLAALADDRVLLERAATRGNRVVLSFQLSAGPKPEDAKTLENDWHVPLETDTAKDHVHRFYFGEAKDWRVLDRVGPKNLAIEKPFGKGVIALFVESDDFNNLSTIAGDRLRQVSSAIGPHRYVVFDEHHFGIAEGGSIMQMARRFRMGGIVLGLLLVAALSLWRNAAGFPPSADVAASGRLTGRTSHAGLLTLLRRHIPPRELAEACWREWLNGNRGQVSPARLEQATEIVRNSAARPLDAAREIAAVLHPKGEL